MRRHLFLLFFASIGVASPVNSETIIYEGKPGDPGRSYPGLPWEERNWILGSWIDGTISKECSRPAVRIYMMATVGPNSYIAGVSGPLRVGGAFVDKIVIDETTAKLYLSRRARIPDPPYGDPVVFRRISGGNVSLILKDGTEYPLRLCQGTNKPPVSSGSRSGRAGELRDIPSTMPERDRPSIMPGRDQR